MRGKSAFQIAQDFGYSGDIESWIDTLEGDSAYDIYIDFTSDNPVKTKTEWLESLKGEQGTSETHPIPKGIIVPYFIESVTKCS